MVAATKASQGPLGPAGALECTHSAYTSSQAGLPIGLFGEVWLRQFRAPPIGSLFTLSPSHTHTHTLSFFCFMSFPASCPIISLCSFSCVHISPARSTHVHNYPGLDNQVRLTVCPCAIGFPFIAATYTFVPSRPLFMSSFSCPCCAHICTLVCHFEN